MSANARRSFIRLNRQPIDNSWYVVVLLGLLFLFWVYARFIERVDATLVENWLIGRQLAVLAELPGLSFILSFFHWNVLRHIVAVIVGWYFARDAALVLVQVLYDLPDRESAKKFLSRLLGYASTAQSIPEVAPATLAADRKNSVLLRVGGPGRVKVPAGHVIVTELNGRFQRILSVGKHTLGRYEYIHAVLNLQPQERTDNEFTAYSRDGIELRVGVSIVYRLKMGDQIATRENPYPYDETAVRTAAYAQTVTDDRGSVTTWEDTPLAMARSTMIGILAGFRLDEIISPQRPGEEPYRTLRNELLRQLRGKLDGLGIDLQAVSINRIELPEGVTEQYIDYWKSHWESQMLLNLIDGTAAAVEESEIARAEAEIMMIQAIQEGVQRALREGATANMDEVVALRLVEAIEMMARHSQQMTPLPNTLIPQLDNLRKQLHEGVFDQNPPGKPIQ
ncbi:MAG: SPFH domain-containing protein [Anaerolineaceae bacterium]|nr:SPFH domain-containing protein [Anaerolineaceae bacterium]